MHRPGTGGTEAESSPANAAGTATWGTPSCSRLHICDSFKDIQNQNQLQNLLHYTNTLHYCRPTTADTGGLAASWPQTPPPPQKENGAADDWQRTQPASDFESSKMKPMPKQQLPERLHPNWVRAMPGQRLPKHRRPVYYQKHCCKTEAAAFELQLYFLRRNYNVNIAKKLPNT